MFVPYPCTQLAHRKLRILTFVLSTVFLGSCGGGSNDSDSPGADEQGSSGSDPLDEPSTNDPGVTPSEPEITSPPDDGSSDPTPPTEPEDTPVSLSGVEGRVLFHDLGYSGASALLFNGMGKVAFDGGVVDPVFMIPTSDEGLWMGSISDGTALVFEQGSPIPPLSGATRFNGISSLSLASDGSVAVNLSTSGAQQVSVLGSVQGGEFLTLVRTGQQLGDELDAPQIMFFQEYSRSPTLTALRVDILQQGAVGMTRTLLVFPDSSPGTTINLATDVPQGVAGASGCFVSFENAGRVGEFGIGRGVQALNDGSVVFDIALVGDECMLPKAIVRFTEGTFELVIGAGEVVASNSNLTYQDVQLLDALADDTLMLYVQIDSDVPTEVRRAVTMSINPAGERHLRLTQSQRYTTPTLDYGNTMLAGTSAPSYNVGGAGAMIVKLPRADRTNETAVFATPARSFLVVGETLAESENRTLEYRVGTLDPVPEPYEADHYFANISTVHALSDGSIVFMANVRHPDIGGNVSHGIWIVDAGEERQVRELYRFGEALLEEASGETRVFDNVLSSNGSFASDESGGLYFVGTASFGIRHTLVRLDTRP